MEKIINNRKKHSSIGKIILWVCVGILAAVFFSAVFAVVVKYLWNWLMTDIFSLPAIDYLQAFGLILLTRLLVGGWHKGDHENHHKDRFHHFFKKKKNDYSDRIDVSKEEFSDYWEKEGKASFKSYLEKKSGAGNPEK